MKPRTQPTTDDLQVFVTRPTPRNLAELDAMAMDPIRKMSRVRPFLIIWTLIAYPIPTIIFLSTPNRDSFSNIFFVGWIIMALLIGAFGVWSQGSLKKKHLKLLQHGQARKYHIVQRMPRSRAHRKSNVQIFELESEDGERRLMSISMMLADHLEEGVPVHLLRHDDFVNALWVLPDGLPPMMTLLNPR